MIDRLVGKYLNESDWLTLTYGVLPDYNKFEKKFKKYVGKSYNYNLKGSDASMAKKVGVPTSGDFNAKQLYDVVKKLVDAFDDGDDEAGDLASSILYTMEIEWV